LLWYLLGMLFGWFIRYSLDDPSCPLGWFSSHFNRFIYYNWLTLIMLIILLIIMVRLIVGVIFFVWSLHILYKGWIFHMIIKIYHLFFLFFYVLINNFQIYRLWLFYLLSLNLPYRTEFFFIILRYLTQNLFLNLITLLSLIRLDTSALGAYDLALFFLIILIWGRPINRLTPLELLRLYKILLNCF